MKGFKVFEICKDDCGRRLDRIVRRVLVHLPLSKVYALIRNGKVLVNGIKQSQKYLVERQDVLEISNEAFENAREEKLAPSEKKTISPSSILYQDEDFLVLAKQAGELVHGKNSLDELVKGTYKNRSEEHTSELQSH